MRWRHTAVVLLVVSALVVGCGAGGRSAAIEACFEARNLFARVPNPSAGQEIADGPGLLGPGLLGPAREPNFIRPSGTDVARRVARVRSLAAQSGDRTLARLADALERSPSRDTTQLLSHCSREGY